MQLWRKQSFIDFSSITYNLPLGWLLETLSCRMRQQMKNFECILEESGREIEADVIKEDYKKKDSGTTITEHRHVVRRQSKTKVTKLEQGKNKKC